MKLIEFVQNANKYYANQSGLRHTYTYNYKYTYAYYINIYILN